MVKRRAARSRGERDDGSHAKPDKEMRLVGALLQPTSHHYNGQGVVRPSACIPLHADDFELHWRQLWSMHVNFGTSKSHKKLTKKAGRQAMAASAAQYGSVAVQRGAVIVRPTERRPAHIASVASRPRAAAAVVSDLALQQRKRAIMGSKAALLLAGAGSGGSDGTP